MVPTYVLDYPEAHRAMAHLSATRGVVAAGVLEAVGSKLSSQRRVDRPLCDAPFIVVNGSGNYHHETATLVESLLARPGAESVGYVHVDAHPDSKAQYRWQCNCASFLGRLLENPRVSSAWLLGAYPACTKEPELPMPYIDKLDYFRCDYFGKVHKYLVGPWELGEAYLPFSDQALASARRNSSVRAARAESPALPDGTRVSALVVDWRTLEELDTASLPPGPLYVSVDLDVARERPVTDWRRAAKLAPGDPGGRFTQNQGDMEWATLIELVDRLGAARRIVGADFCGLLEKVDWLPPDRLADSLEAIGEIYDALVRAIERGGKVRVRKGRRS